MIGPACLFGQTIEATETPLDLSTDGSIPPPPGKTKRTMCLRFMVIIVAMQLVYVAATAIADVAMGRTGDILTNILAAVFPSALKCWGRRSLSQSLSGPLLSHTPLPLHRLRALLLTVVAYILGGVNSYKKAKAAATPPTDLSTLQDPNPTAALTGSFTSPLFYLQQAYTFGTSVFFIIVVLIERRRIRCALFLFSCARARVCVCVCVCVRALTDYDLSPPPPASSRSLPPLPFVLQKLDRQPWKFYVL